MNMAVEPDSAGVRFPPPFIYLGALLFAAGVATMLAAAALFRRLGTDVPNNCRMPWLINGLYHSE
jgi:Zn-dependent M28 family amino/carboxypeptidase